MLKLMVDKLVDKENFAFYLIDLYTECTSHLLRQQFITLKHLSTFSNAKAYDFHRLFSFIQHFPIKIHNDKLR